MTTVSLHRRPVRLFPPVGLSLLFRPLPKGASRPTLDVRYELSSDHWLRFSARESLGVPEQTLLLAVLELAGEHYVQEGDGATLTRNDARAMPSRLWGTLYPDGGTGLPDTLMVSTTWDELNHRCGAANGGSMIASRRASLRRLCEVVVWEEHAQHKSVRQAFLMVWLEGDDRRIHLAVNHMLAASFFGGQYAKLWMVERLQLGSDLAMHVHAFLSTWVRQGGPRFSILLSTLAARVWPDNHDTAPAGTIRRRRLELQIAVDAIGRLSHWSIEWSGQRTKLTVDRAASGSVRDTTSSDSVVGDSSHREQVQGPSTSADNDLSRNDVSVLFN
ncbi:hypothetical protein LPB72_07250 [Hydrogenophaga crassostreae]|uniref:Replication initiator protein A n=1 Tax=Hydrogenophaga crassostreae TaxID=1763535 RepID=A0A167IG88_9BURK|nr:replication protein C, IncQ-type [Hydrogenophaga crassostreae]AOW13157.1 hypothetical protein LPB072_10120 [Hydrogenophaga crassostreae]OAD42697.1 hypothetical protein LPB72_07250 [Hydrogenophaga crassostreae]